MLNSCKDDPSPSALPIHRKPLGRLDLDALQRMLQICSMEAMLIDADQPRATLGSLRQGAAIACTMEHDFALRCCFGVPSDYLLLGYIHHAGRNSWSRADVLESGNAFSLAPGIEADFMFGAGTRATLLLMKTASLNSYLQPLLDDARQQQIFQPSMTGRPADLDKIYQQLRWKILLHSDPAYALPTEPFDFERLLECHGVVRITASESINGSPSRYRHYLVVQQVEKYLRSNLTSDIYLTQMCHVAKVSERTLRYAFDELLGISPMCYLGMLRLCVASRSLSQADARRRSVKSIAMDCGLRDLSRFAQNYRCAFGELPHDTLMRPAKNPAAPSL